MLMKDLLFYLMHSAVNTKEALINLIFIIIRRAGALQMPFSSIKPWLFSRAPRYYINS